ncbi:MAG: type I secretion protein [Paracoccus sp.]|nr:type I secretion protein [Paracoccus sp. (in: a-proteobacteria)]
MGYEWAFIANWLIFGGLTMLYADPFDLFGSDDDDDRADDDGRDPGITRIGTDADEVIEGTERDDILSGMAGNDRLIGLGGDDALAGNTGRDTLEGGDGNDTLAGGGGTDLLLGGAGDDIISVDRLDREAIWTRGGAETLSGGEGNDFLFFTPDDIADGGTGQDSFNLILTPEGGPATISDFDPADDQLTLYAEFDPENPPLITVRFDEASQTTQVLLGDRQTLTLNGNFTAEQLAVRLLTQEQLPF